MSDLASMPIQEPSGIRVSLDRIPIPALAFDRETGRIRHLNPAAIRFGGVSEPLEPGLSLGYFVPDWSASLEGSPIMGIFRGAEGEQPVQIWTERLSDDGLILALIQPSLASSLPPSEYGRHVQLIFEKAFEFIGLLDHEGRLLEPSPSALRLIEVDRSEVVGRPFWETPWWRSSTEGQERLKAAIVRALAGEFVRFEAEHPAAGGAAVIVDFSLQPLMDSQGNVAFLVAEGRDITERKHLEEQLRLRTDELAEAFQQLSLQRDRIAVEMAEQTCEKEEMESLFRRLFEGATIGIALVGLDGHLRETNSAFQTMLDFSQETLSHLTFDCLGFPAGAKEFQGAFEALVEGRSSSVCMERRFCKRDGREFWGCLRASVLPSSQGRPRYILVMLEDIHVRKKAEKRRVVQHALTEAILQQRDAPSAVMRVLRTFARTFDWEYGEYWVPDAASARLQYVMHWPEVSRDSTGSELTFPSGIGLPGRIWESGKPAWVSDVLKDANFHRKREAGHHGIRGAIGFPLQSPAGVHGVLVFFTRSFREPDPMLIELMADIGGQLGQYLGRLAAEGEMRRTLQELSEANQQLREVDRYKDEFLSLVSHELNTPLNFIMGFASILEDLDSAATPLQVNCVRKILAGADRLAALIRNILLMSRIQAGRLRINPSRVRIEAVVGAAVEQLTSLADQKGLTMEMDVQVPGEVSVDGHYLGLVLCNLLENAIKFSPDGGAIRLAARVAGPEIRIQVEDSGCGISSDDLPKLFTRLQQLDMSSTRKAGGLGLGLSLCKAIVEAHGGTIGVSSEVEHGSVFWFSVPVPDAE